MLPFTQRLIDCVKGLSTAKLQTVNTHFQMKIGRFVPTLPFLAFACAAVSITVQLAAQDAIKVNAELTTDQWAGKTVRNASHVQKMVESRLMNAPKVGEKAPETLVFDAKTGGKVKLSDFYQTKPVVTFFASYSCMCSQKTSGFMSALSKKYGDRFQFVLIYIREAHPIGGMQSGPAGSEFIIPDPLNLEQRREAAIQFAEKRKLDFPILIDSMDDTQAVQWGAWPARLFLIDQRGTVVYSGQQGPWFVKPTEDFDFGMHGVPEFIRDLPGYSKGSLEESLKKFDVEKSER